MRLIDADAIEYTMLYKENWLEGTGYEAQAVWKADIDKMPTASQWIPVTERLPEKYGVYLCTFEGEDETDVDTLLFAHGAFGHIDWEAGEFVEWGHEVTAWMPLPEPWKEEENV